MAQRLALIHYHFASIDGHIPIVLLAEPPGRIFKFWPLNSWNFCKIKIIYFLRFLFIYIKNYMDIF